MGSSLWSTVRAASSLSLRTWWVISDTPRKSWWPQVSTASSMWETTMNLFVICCRKASVSERWEVRRFLFKLWDACSGYVQEIFGNCFSRIWKRISFHGNEKHFGSRSCVLDADNFTQQKKSKSILGALGAGRRKSCAGFKWREVSCSTQSCTISLGRKVCRGSTCVGECDEKQWLYSVPWSYFTLELTFIKVQPWEEIILNCRRPEDRR